MSISVSIERHLSVKATYCTAVRYFNKLTFTNIMGVTVVFSTILPKEAGDAAHLAVHSLVVIVCGITHSSYNKYRGSDLIFPITPTCTMVSLISVYRLWRTMTCHGLTVWTIISFSTDSTVTDVVLYLCDFRTYSVYAAVYCTSYLISRNIT